MAHRRALVAASAVQLAAGLAGQVVALRRRKHYDIPFMTGSPANVGRDSWWLGTAFSAPSYMLGSQAWAIATLRRRPEERARAALRLLGTSMIPGYLLERQCRRRLTPGSLDRVETPIVAVGLAGSVAMALLGRPQLRP
ncbi:hypothetical protein ACI78T_00270 [Blastococcus sp. SYSU D00922]